MSLTALYLFIYYVVKGILELQFNFERNLISIMYHAGEMGGIHIDPKILI